VSRGVGDLLSIGEKRDKEIIQEKGAVGKS
jgi:hypothetical protein